MIYFRELVAAHHADHFDTSGSPGDELARTGGWSVPVGRSGWCSGADSRPRTLWSVLEPEYLIINFEPDEIVGVKRATAIIRILKQRHNVSEAAD